MNDCNDDINDKMTPMQSTLRTVTPTDWTTEEGYLAKMATAQMGGPGNQREGPGGTMELPGGLVKDPRVPINDN